MTSDPPLGLELRERRRERGWSRGRLADEIGVSPPAVSGWELNRHGASDEHSADLIEIFGESERDDNLEERQSGDEDWKRRALDLEGSGGVPKKCAQAVALWEQGHDQREIINKIGWESRSTVSHMIESYRTKREQAEWLVEHGPEDI